MFLDTPFVSAAMQAVTGVELATALAELGGVGVLPASEPLQEQCRKAKQIKQYKAGFKTDAVTFSPSALTGQVDHGKDVLFHLPRYGYGSVPW